MMQSDVTIAEVNRNPRPEFDFKLTDEDVRGLGYLAGIAGQKKFAATLIVNCYNSKICGADIASLSYFCRGESCDTLQNAMYLLIQLSAYIESQELYGSDFVEDLITQWKLRDKT